MTESAAACCMLLATLLERSAERGHHRAGDCTARVLSVAPHFFDIDTRRFIQTRFNETDRISVFFAAQLLPHIVTRKLKVSKSGQFDVDDFLNAFG